MLHNIVVYHYPCPDGEMSAAIFKDHLISQKNTQFIPWLHENKQQNIENILNILHNNMNKPYIYFLDYCPEFEFIIDIINNVSKVIILDHHKSPCELFNVKLQEHSNLQDISKINFIFKNNMSGCMITWEYLNNNTNYPKPLEYIGKRDIWIWDDINIEPFTSGYHIYCNINNNIDYYERIEIFRKLLKSSSKEINRIIEIGNNNINNMKKEAKQICKKLMFEEDTDINNKVLKIVLVNMKKYHLTKYVQEEIETKYTNYDVLKLKYVKYNMIFFSLRSLKDDIRVDLLAQKYGGNGHMKASGYSLPI